MDKKSLSIIIPHFNGEKILKDCLDSILLNSYTDFEIVIIDNGSTDNSIQMIKKNYPKIKLIENNENRGYAGACNQGMWAVRAGRRASATGW